MSARPARIVTAILLALSLIPANRAQTKEPHWDELLKAIPQAQRSELVNLINQVVNYEKTRNYDALYDLLDSDYTYGSRQKFRQSQIDADVLQSFDPDELVEIVDGDWELTGCADFLEKGQKELHCEASLGITRIPGVGWRFSRIMGIYAYMDSPLLLPCSAGKH